MELIAINKEEKFVNSDSLLKIFVDARNLLSNPLVKDHNIK